MDYSRIYSEFIADRKRLAPEGYFERHHIMPRSLGGSDERSNLIDLSPEDHFFAHLLLAKIHGGKMASALQLLADTAGRRWSLRFCSRRAYGLGKRIAARLKGEAWTAEGNPNFRPELVDWANYRTGENRRATIYEMHLTFGASRPSWTAVANGSRPSLRGWLLAHRLSAHRHSEKGKLFTFVNRDGREFSGTQGEFAKEHGLSLPAASRIIRHDSVTRCGWRRKGAMDRPHNFAKDGLPARLSRARALNAT